MLSNFLMLYVINEFLEKLLHLTMDLIIFRIFTQNLCRLIKNILGLFI